MIEINKDLDQLSGVDTLFTMFMLTHYHMSSVLSPTNLTSQIGVTHAILHCVTYFLV